MPVIAMTQEMASLGKDVALGVAEKLGLQLVRHEIGDLVAGRMQVKKSLIRRIREGKAGKIEKWAADEKTMSIFTAEEVFDLAVKGNVLIRGWGATLLLRAVPHIPCIRVCAPFELRVWAALREIPPGRTSSYGAIAKQLGAPSACRAVGAANGANPVSIIVPCHRVIGSSGALTGYGGGLDRKRWLLDHEAWIYSSLRAAIGST